MGTIYKYTSAEGALGILNDRGIKLSNPTDFNDVFDCRFDIDEEQSKKRFELFKKFSFFIIAFEEMKKVAFIFQTKNNF